MDKIGSKERAPALAILELDSAKVSGKMNEDEWVKAVQAYWKRWGGKGVVVDDLQVAAVGREQLLLALAKEWSRGSHVSRCHDKHLKVKESVDDYLRQKHATLLALKLETKWTASEAEFESLWKLYNGGLQYGSCLSTGHNLHQVSTCRKQMFSQRTNLVLRLFKCCCICTWNNLTRHCCSAQ